MLREPTTTNQSVPDKFLEPAVKWLGQMRNATTRLLILALLRSNAEKTVRSTLRTPDTGRPGWQPCQIANKGLLRLSMAHRKSSSTTIENSTVCICAHTTNQTFGTALR